MRWLLSLLVLLSLLAGCGSPNAPTAGSATTTGAATAAPAGAAYPYPYPGPGGEGQGPRFTLDGPILTVNESISGTGPAGVPVRLIRFARDAEVIGETVIGPDGTFSIPVSGLSTGDIIGLALGDLAGTSLNADDFASGPGYKDVSGFGVVFASEVILE